MKYKILALIVLISTLTACGVKEYKLPKGAYDIIPYKGNEILVFESNTKDTDTIFLKGNHRYLSSIGDAFVINPNKAEVYSILYHHPKLGKIQQFISVSIYLKDSYEVNFDIAIKNASCYGRFLFTEADFHAIPNTNLEVNNVYYNDVKVFECKDIESEYFDSMNRVYWSVSTGLLGWDVNNETWRLKNE